MILLLQSSTALRKRWGLHQTDLHVPPLLAQCVLLPPSLSSRKGKDALDYAETAEEATSQFLDYQGIKKGSRLLTRISG